jgi:hypothetical protein
MKEIHIVDTGKRRVTITIEEEQFQVIIKTELSRHGIMGDENHIQQIKLDALKKYENDTRLIVLISGKSKIVGRRLPDGSWNWLGLSNNDGDDSTGGNGGSGHDDKPGKPPRAPSGIQTPRRAIQPGIVSALATEQKESELVGV